MSNFSGFFAFINNCGKFIENFQNKNITRQIKISGVRFQISLLILSELITLYSPWNYLKNYDFLQISGGIEVINSPKFA